VNCRSCTLSGPTIAPINKGQKVYALLRDTLASTGKVGLAKVVIQTKQHLAALVPSGSALVLNLLRWGDEIKTFDGLELPPTGGKGASFSAAEKKMAEQLVNEMTGDWDPEAFKDEFKHAIMALVDKKVKAGKTEAVVEPEEQAPSQGADIIDLTALLARSLKGGGGSSGGNASAKAATKTSAKTTGRKAASKDEDEDDTEGAASSAGTGATKGAKKPTSAGAGPSGLALSAKTTGTKVTGTTKAKKTTKASDKNAEKVPAKATRTAKTKRAA